MAGAAGPPNFDLPEEVLSVLPTDPFEQLDVARKITSIALATRISSLESEVSDLRRSLSERDDIVAELRAKLRAKLETLDASLADVSDRLARANDEKEMLLNENASLSNTIKKLNRDVSRLEVFKKTLMQSLQDEEESPQGVARVAPKVSEAASFSSVDDDDAGLLQTKSSLQRQLSETGSSAPAYGAYSEADAFKEGSKPTSLLGSLGGTPKLTPPGSPPRRHSISVATARSMFDDKSSIYSSLPSSHHSSMSSPFDTGAQGGRTRVDGKEFFRQVRSRLSYEQFSAFLSNVKELNAHKQSREETLRKAGEIFGPENKDLYAIFEGLINRKLY